MLLNVRTACFLFFFFLFFWLIVLFLNRSESFIHHRFVTLTIERIHSTQVSRPYWSRYLSFLVSSPSSLPHPRIPYYVFLTLPPYHNHPTLSLFFHHTLSCMYAARSRLLAFRLFSNPTQRYSHDILASRRYRYPTTKHRTNQGKNRSSLLLPLSIDNSSLF